VGGQEDKIIALINHNDYHAFTPKQIRIWVRKGLKIRKSVPLFRGYVFVETNEDVIDFLTYLNIYIKPVKGFIRLLRYENNQIETVLPHERNWIESLCNDQFVIEPSLAFIEGDRIRIIEGPLMGHESEIKKVNRHKRSVEVELTMFDQIQRITLDCEVIQKIQN
jgi:transcriptional antiterminator NusG